MLTPDLADSLGGLAADHLWQSTAVAAIAALLAYTLKGNSARVRHWLWLAASVKFLVPFSLLASLGGALGRWLLPAAPVSRLPLAMEQMVQPFTPLQDAAFSSVAPTVHAPSTHGLLGPLLVALWLLGFVAVFVYGCVRWRRAARLVRSSTPIVEGRELAALRRIARHGSRPLPGMVSSPARLEPCAVGIFRPVLCLPAGIADRLDDAELEAVLMHELCHIRRRDGLTAVVHMAVEAIFWFHPLVWWLSTRLTEERERACDEEVIRMGGEPEVYAESILKVCEFYLASPVACAAAVAGGELKARIEGIMKNGFARNLSLEKKLLLAAVALAAISVPLAFGIARAGGQAGNSHTVGVAPRFEVVSIKPLQNEMGGAWDTLPRNGRWTARAIGIPALIAYAYGVSGDRVEGIPKSMQGHVGFNIVAKLPGATRRADFFLMVQSMLADRFHAIIHTETREIPVNTIEIAKGGVKLRPPSGQCEAADGNAALPEGQFRCNEIKVGVSPRDGNITWTYSGRSVSMAELAKKLSGNRLTVDDTGLAGVYDFDVTIVSKLTRSGEATFETESNWQYDWRTAWEKQAGLTIDQAKTTKRAAPVIVVDHIELPTEN